MPVMTFTTDFGLRDHYVAFLKAKALQFDPALTFIDITHEVEKYNIAHGAFVLGAVYYQFPEQSVHLFAVNACSRQQSRFVIAEINGHYFIGPDNGFLRLVSSQEPSRIVEVEDAGDNVFPSMEVFIRKGIQLLHGTELGALGNSLESYNQLFHPEPKRTREKISGNVIHVDDYGNLITNIDQEGFEHMGQGRTFRVQFRRETITNFAQTYKDVEEGDCLAFFNSMGLLEIAINQGDAARLLGMEYNSPVHIYFE